jgi:hypothetical protein
MGLSRRKFTKQFKEEAIRRLELGAPLAEVARACASSRDRTVAERCLDQMDGGAVVQGVTGVGVPEPMRGNGGGLGDSSPPCGSLEKSWETSSSK